jgi:hypothetical protein
MRRRYNISAIPQDVLNRYAAAIVEAKKDLVSDTGIAWFLPWHRLLLWYFESRILRNQPDIGIPYWDWMAGQRPTIPAPFDTDKGVPGLKDAGPKIDLFRWKHVPSRSCYEEHVARLNSWDAFGGPTGLMERVHNVIHNVVTGVMPTLCAPCDMLFWSHHSFVDLLWFEKRSTVGHPASILHKTIHLLHPHAAAQIAKSIPELLDLEQLGYEYVAAARTLSPHRVDDANAIWRINLSSIALPEDCLFRRVQIRVLPHHRASILRVDPSREKLLPIDREKDERNCDPTNWPPSGMTPSSNPCGSTLSFCVYKGPSLGSPRHEGHEHASLRFDLEAASFQKIAKAADPALYFQLADIEAKPVHPQQIELLFLPD